MSIITFRPSYNLYCWPFRTQSGNTLWVLTRKETFILSHDCDNWVCWTQCVLWQYSFVTKPTHFFLFFLLAQDGSSLHSFTSRTERPHQGHSVGTLGKCESASKTLYFCNSNECKGLKHKERNSFQLRSNGSCQYFWTCFDTLDLDRLIFVRCIN